MSLQETMTNVIDHSGVQDYYVCCWNYPERKEIRLCIADLGIGIKASLKKSANSSIQT
jgi:anti-sigma regulatory factor (Ser/Thr protein kinase)